MVREKMQNGSMGDKRFEDEGGEGVQDWQREELYIRCIQAEGVQGESHSVTSGDTAGGQLQERELPRALNL